MSVITVPAAIGMLQTGRFSDFKIICEEFTFNVHKNILYHASPFFAAIIDGPFVESHENEATIQETSCLAVAFMILDIYIDNFGLDLAYQVWPTLRNHSRLSLEYPDDGTWTLNKAYESMLGPTKAEAFLEMQTYIRLCELADRLLLPQISSSAADQVINTLTGNFSSPSQVPGMMPSFADNARIMLDIYQCPSADGVLRRKSIALCVQYNESMEAAGGDDALVLQTVREHPDISHDYEVGMEVARMMQMDHDQNGSGACVWSMVP